jgi:2-polyprenyl-3-methyl-5-hydroxy-6-metoxy-1,4-benzoquinol methylase
MSDERLLRQGHYARKQLFSRNAVVAWSHRRRFARARDLVTPYAGGTLLDYGCGDGTFIALVHELFAEATGTDIDDAQVAGCTERLGSLTHVRFVPLDRFANATDRDRYDAIVCMEVLEHCPSDVQPRIIRDLARLSRPGGVVIISVPIEIGLTLVVKQAVRAAAAASGLTEYAHRERYRPAEFARMLMAGKESQIERPSTTATTAAGATVRFHGHKGFNWHLLERLIEGAFTIERRLYSPVPVTGSWLNSQVWFVCRKLMNEVSASARAPN